jgi:hypothetical protein
MVAPPYLFAIPIPEIGYICMYVHKMVRRSIERRIAIYGCA